MELAKRVARRKHDAELKAQVVAECAAPGASVASVALAHGLNANLVHRWRRIAEGREPGRHVARHGEEFVALPIAAPAITKGPCGGINKRTMPTTFAAGPIPARFVERRATPPTSHAAAGRSRFHELRRR